MIGTQISGDDCLLGIRPSSLLSLKTRLLALYQIEIYAFLARTKLTLVVLTSSALLSKKKPSLTIPLSLLHTQCGNFAFTKILREIIYDYFEFNSSIIS